MTDRPIRVDGQLVVLPRGRQGHSVES